MNSIMERSKFKVDSLMDIRDVNCPISLLRCQKRLKEIPEGAVLEITGNHKGVRADLIALVSRSAGKWLVGDRWDGDYFYLYVQKGGEQIT
jgi:TusA-related sulfurtransferase